jgi:D-amino-acid dehydrogenase
VTAPLDDTLPPLAAGEQRCEWLVVGAGIVGLSAALRLRQAGHGVTLIDRRGVAAEASRGNAGAYAFSDILPMATPGIVRQVPRWLLDPLGPLALPPAYLPQMLPWLWRFWRASRPAQVAASTLAQVVLMRLSASATPALLQSIGAGHLLHRDGNLQLYESHAEWQASLPGWALRAEHGIAFEHLHGAEAIAAMQPGLAPGLVAATFVPDWPRIEDPLQLAEQVAAALHGLGAVLRRAEALRLSPQPDGIHVALAGGGEVLAQRVLVAAGAWSHRLARTLGDHLPLETERGYNTTLPAGAFALRRQLTFGGHGFVVTPIGAGVRVGGAVELGGLDAAPNYRRSAALLAKAARFMPGLKTEGGTQWMGFRPSLPDSLPAIGAAPGDARVLYAFGHGHLGLTQSAATAALVLELASGRATAIDLTAFSPGRFR